MERRLEPLTILIAALGGQGGGVLAEWLVDAATRAGYLAQSTSIPGVAQRTGATTYYVEIFPVPLADLEGRLPVLSLLPTPGAIDLFVASELLEAGRTIASGVTSAERTTVIASTSRTLTTAEKMALGDGRFASDRLLAVARSHARRLLTFDMEAAAQEASTAVSAVMFGAVAGTGLLPFDAATCEAVIRDGGAAPVEGSLRGFASGLGFAQRSSSASGIASAVAESTSPDDAVVGEFPQGARNIVAIGLARVTDFQDRRYGELYLDRLRRVAAAERVADPRAGHAGALTREAARFLALWMAFDDIVKVASLKCRASRFARVRREVAAADGDLLRIVDYFKPGIPEFAGLLPPSLAQRLVAYDRRRQARGKAPLGIALTVRANGLAGFVALRMLAGLRGWRPRSARYTEEQAAIERWLDAIVAGAASDWALGYEIALAGRLVKGYGTTNERGKRNLEHILANLQTLGGAGSPAEQAIAVAQAREAALADEDGLAFDRVLSARGVPPRPPRAQPIVWAKRAPGKHAA